MLLLRINGNRYRRFLTVPGMLRVENSQGDYCALAVPRTSGPLSGDSYRILLFQKSTAPGYAECWTEDVYELDLDWGGDIRDQYFPIGCEEELLSEMGRWV